MNPRFRPVIWFAGIYLMSVGTIAIVALVIRMVLSHHVIQNKGDSNAYN